MNPRKPAIPVLALAAIVSLAACSEESASPFSPVVANLSETFELHAAGVDNATATEEYTWSNSGTMANVDQATIVSSGSASLVILDSSGTTVYTRDLSEGGTFFTEEGVSGSWTIRVTVAGYTGDMDFSVETP